MLCPWWPHSPGHSCCVLQGVFGLRGCAVRLSTSMPSPINSPSRFTGDVRRVRHKAPKCAQKQQDVKNLPRRSELTSAPAGTCQSSAPSSPFQLSALWWCKASGYLCTLWLWSRCRSFIYLFLVDGKTQSCRVVQYLINLKHVSLPLAAF